MIKGGRDPIFPLWTATFPSLSHLSPTPGKFQSIQCHFPIVYSPLQLPDTSGRASARGKAADAGQRRALEREAEQATVDAASPDHLEPPPCASRGASTSATRHRAGPLVSPSLSPPAARAQSRPARPMHGLARASTRALPHSSSLFLAPHSTPTDAVDSPSPSLLASQAVVTATRAPRPR